jgi:hypothetical protein
MASGAAYGRLNDSGALVPAISYQSNNNVTQICFEYSTRCLPMGTTRFSNWAAILESNAMTYDISPQDANSQAGYAAQSRK